MEETATTLAKIGYPQLCYKCDATVSFARTRSGKRILMDFYPTNEGRYVIERMNGSEAIVRRLNHASPNPELQRFTCHYDTCPRRRRTRAKGRTEPGHGLTGASAGQETI